MPHSWNARLRLSIAIAAVAGAAACHSSASDRQATTVADNTMPPALPSALPLSAGQMMPAAYAPPVRALPERERVRLGRLARPDDGYAYLDRAWWFDDASDRAPPDYRFDYDGVSPWAWDYDGGGRVFVEPVADGYRSYYYAPGADTPFFVRDPGYSYAFDGPMLVAMYGADGAPVELVPDMPSVRYASRYYTRGRDLHRADVVARRQGVAGPAWAQAQPRYAAVRQTWSGDLGRNGSWRAWHEAHIAQAQPYWRQQREVRHEGADRFAAWQRGGFAGPAPALYRPSASRPAMPAAGLPPHQAMPFAAAGLAGLAGRGGPPAAGPMPRPGWVNGVDNARAVAQQRAEMRGQQMAQAQQRQTEMADQQRRQRAERQSIANQRHAEAMQQQAFQHQAMAQQRREAGIQHQQGVAAQHQAEQAQRQQAMAQRQAAVAQRQQGMAEQRQAANGQRQQAMVAQRQQAAVEHQAAVVQQRQAMAAQGQAMNAQHQQAMAAQRQQAAVEHQAAMAQQRQAIAAQRQSENAQRQQAMAAQQRQAAVAMHPGHPGDPHNHGHEH